MVGNVVRPPKNIDQIKKKVIKEQQSLIMYLMPPNIPNKCNGILSVSSKALIFTINGLPFLPEGGGLLIYIVVPSPNFRSRLQTFK